MTYFEILDPLIISGTAECRNLKIAVALLREVQGRRQISNYPAPKNNAWPGSWDDHRSHANISTIFTLSQYTRLADRQNFDRQGHAWDKIVFTSNMHNVCRPTADRAALFWRVKLTNDVTEKVSPCRFDCLSRRVIRLCGRFVQWRVLQT